MTMPKKSKEEVLAGMDADAKLAREEFEQIRASSDKATFETIHGLIAAWWEKWFQRAGHKRLACILMGKKLNGD